MDDWHSGRNSAHRFTVSKVDDSGTENYLNLSGIPGYKPTKVMHVQPFGLSSPPPSGSHLIGLHLGHSAEKMVAFGGEHSDHKPKSIGAGNVALYNADGTIMKMIGKNAEYVGSSFTFKCGGVTMVLNSDGLTITSGQVKHNDKNIGSDHYHTNSGGSGNGGPPA